tara:strand:+ start:301 stop:657 length:357 start_codon:yes stop_codon:yes gene_type:complete
MARKTNTFLIVIGFILLAILIVMLFNGSNKTSGVYVMRPNEITRNVYRPSFRLPAPPRFGPSGFGPGHVGPPPSGGSGSGGSGSGGSGSGGSPPSDGESGGESPPPSGGDSGPEGFSF